MAYVKIVPIKKGTHLQNSFDYIENPSKTKESFLVSSYMCSVENVMNDFESVHQFAMKKGNNIAHHIYQSFSPEDGITPEQAMEIGKELMKRMYPNHQYIIATHTDREHIHNHILVNAVDFVDYKKLHSNKESLNNMRDISDNICRENGLSVIEPRTGGSIKRLKDTIDKVIQKSKTFDEFLGYMQEENYELKVGKYISLKGEDDKRFNRLNSLGTAYTESAVKRRINNPDKEIKNKQRQVYDTKAIRGSKRKRLKFDINQAIKKANSYDDFLQIMGENYEIKTGKHLAFRAKGTERFVRLDSLKNDDFTEEMIRIRIEDPAWYDKIKKEKEENRIDKVIVAKDSVIPNYYQASKNITARIKTMKYLNENGIESVEQLEKMIESKKAEIQKENTKISSLKREVSEKFDIMNAKKTYWQYKPIADQVRNIKKIEERSAFMDEHKEELNKMKAAIEVINNAKDTSGNLPSKEKLYADIETLNEAKEHLNRKVEKAQEELKKLENIHYNLTVDEEEQEKASQNKKQKSHLQFL